MTEKQKTKIPFRMKIVDLKAEGLKIGDKTTIIVSLSPTKSGGMIAAYSHEIYDSFEMAEKSFNDIKGTEIKVN